MKTAAPGRRYGTGVIEARCWNCGFNLRWVDVAAGRYFIPKNWALVEGQIQPKHPGPGGILGGRQLLQTDSPTAWPSVELPARILCPRCRVVQLLSTALANAVAQY